MLPGHLGHLIFGDILWAKLAPASDVPQSRQDALTTYFEKPRDFVKGDFGCDSIYRIQTHIYEDTLDSVTHLPPNHFISIDTKSDKGTSWVTPILYYDKSPEIEKKKSLWTVIVIPEL